MRSRYLLPALVVGLGLALLALPAPAAESADAGRVEKLIKQLGSSDFEEREKATRDLDAIGGPALEALRKAADSSDAEVSRRSKTLVARIEKRTQSERILAPKKVHLVYKDTPVADAVADIRKKTGYTINLFDPENKLKDRKVTLDTGETTFWHAFDQFCAKAGLVEATPLNFRPGMPPGGRPVPLPRPLPPVRRGAPAPATPPPAAPGGAGGGGAVQAKPGLAVAVAQAPIRKQAPPVPPPPPGLPPAGGGVAGPGGIAIGRPIGVPMPPMWQHGVITLTDGKAEKRPTDDRSAVRVRAVDKTVWNMPVPDGEIRVILEASPEPRLQWHNLTAVKVKKALDDKDQKLSQTTEAVNPGFPGGAVPPGARIGRPMIAINQPQMMFNGTTPQIFVRLKKGEKASKSLKELSGVITAQLLDEAFPAITVDNVLKAAGKKIKGKNGGFIEVKDVTKGDGGQVTIRFGFEMPPNVIPAMNNMGMMGFGGGMGGGVRIMPAPMPVPPPAPPAPAPAPPRKAPAQAGGGGQAFRAQVVQVGGPGQVVQVQVQVQGQPAIAIAPGGMPGFVGGMNGLTLQDAKGKTLPAQFSMQFVQNGQRFEAQYVFTYRPQKGQGEPAKLVFSGRKAVTIDIPFTLKDVPLP